MTSSWKSLSREGSCMSERAELATEWFQKAREDWDTVKTIFDA